MEDFIPTSLKENNSGSFRLPITLRKKKSKKAKRYIIIFQNSPAIPRMRLYGQKDKSYYIRKHSN